MPFGRNKAIPLSTREYPEYSFREYPKLLGTLNVNGEVMTAAPKPHEAENTVTLVAMNREQEAQLRKEYPDLPVYVPPPSSLSMAEMRNNMTELMKLREENKRLRLQVGGVEALRAEPETDKAAEIEPKPAPVAEIDRGPPGTDAARLAAGEDPHGDPWANLPENKTPEPGNPPSIKGNPAPVQNNKLKR